MKSTVFSSVLFSTVVGYLASQQAEARMTHNMVDRSLSDLARVEDGHLHILTKRNNEAAVNNAHKKHRRHHSRKERRGTCSSGSSSSSSSSNDDADSDSGSAAVYNASGTNSNSGSNSRSSSDSSSSSSSSSPSASTATSRNKSTSNSGSSSGSSSSSSSSDSNNSSSSGSSSSSSSDDSSSSSASSSSSSLASVTGFQGTNSGIGSWFRTNAGQDSTNGESWCETQYQDDWLCFAPDVTTMLNNFGGNRETAGKAYCGREYELTNSANGKSIKAFICDGFDSKWVLTPGSIDLTLAAFTALHGSFNNDKNDVIKKVTWKPTGNVVKAGTFRDSEKQW